MGLLDQLKQRRQQGSDTKQKPQPVQQQQQPEPASPRIVPVNLEDPEEVRRVLERGWRRT